MQPATRVFFPASPVRVPAVVPAATPDSPNTGSTSTFTLHVRDPILPDGMSTVQREALMSLVTIRKQIASYNPSASLSPLRLPSKQHPLANTIDQRLHSLLAPLQPPVSPIRHLTTAALASPLPSASSSSSSSSVAAAAASAPPLPQPSAVALVDPAPPTPVSVDLCRHCNAEMEPDSIRGPHQPSCPRYDTTYAASVSANAKAPISAPDALDLCPHCDAIMERNTRRGMINRSFF
jgi:hypothetical protein